MQLNVPPDVEALLQKRLATGAFANAEDVIRRALETLEPKKIWTEEESAHSTKKSIGRCHDGRIFGPDEARGRLAALMDAHLAKF